MRKTLSLIFGTPLFIGLMVVFFYQSEVKERIEPLIGQESIVVNMPQVDEIIESPLIVLGEAPGTWFFEADFPIFLLTEDGEVIASSFVTAQGDWMTENFVPFEGQIEFETEFERGILRLEKSNPADLSEVPSVEIAVRF